MPRFWISASQIECSQFGDLHLKCISSVAIITFGQVALISDAVERCKCTDDVITFLNEAIKHSESTSSSSKYFPIEFDIGTNCNRWNMIMQHFKPFKRYIYHRNDKLDGMKTDRQTSANDNDSNKKLIIRSRWSFYSILTMLKSLKVHYYCYHQMFDGSVMPSCHLVGHFFHEYNV